MNDKIIKIGHCQHVHNYRIELFEVKHLLWGLIPYFKRVRTLKALKWRDVQDYKMAWAKEYGVKDKNIFDLTKS